MTGEEKMESLWSVFKGYLCCCRLKRSKIAKSRNTASIASSKELIGLDEEGKSEKNDEPPRYSPL